MRRRATLLLVVPFLTAFICVWLAKSPTLAQRLKKANITLVREPNVESQPPGTANYSFELQQFDKFFSLLKDQGYAVREVQGIDDHYWTFTKEEPFMIFFHHHHEVNFFRYNGNIIQSAKSNRHCSWEDSTYNISKSAIVDQRKIS